MARCLGLVVAVILILTGATSAAALTADFATDAGAVTTKYSGFHLGVESWTTDPPDAVIVPLKPYFFGKPSPILRFPGTHAEAGLGYMNVFTCCGGVYPGYNGNWAPWETHVQNQVNAIDPAIRSLIQWEIWNEPDNPLGTFPTFFEAWRRAFVIIRQLVPGATISGPALASYRQQYLQDFLLYAKANNVVPNILGWHEIIYPEWDFTLIPHVGAADFAGRVASMRAFMTANGIPARGQPPLPIQIDEMLPRDYQLKPASQIVSVAHLHRNDIYQAGRACWVEAVSGANNCSRGNESGAVTPNPDYQPRSVWWAMKAYADMAGRYVNVTADANFDGLASWDASTESIRVVLGNVGGNPTTEIRLVNLGAITAATSAQVRVERIPNMEEAALSEPTVVTDSAFTVTGGELKIPISGSKVWDAYAVTVAFSQGSAPAATRGLTIQ